MRLDKNIHDFFESEYENIISVYLFGSTVTDGKGNGSDVDIGLLFDSDSMDLVPECIEDILVRLPRVLQRDRDEYRQ